MKVKLSELESKVQTALKRIGFSDKESGVLAEHLIDAEMSGKKGHGIVRVEYFKNKIEKEPLSFAGDEPVISKETAASIQIDGKNRSGIYVIESFLQYSIEKTKKSGICAVAITSSVNTGYIGRYARKVAEQDLIYIGFHNSPGGLIPYGSTKDLWGTNPFTCGIPSNDLPIVVDFSTSKLTYGDVLEAKLSGEKLPEGYILDENGKPSVEPDGAWAGGILPIAGPKGSGLAMVVEILAGALSFSRVGYDTKGGWGSFFILMDPSIFRDVAEFKNVVSIAINELKTAPKSESTKEILFPGEQSQKARLQCLQEGSIEVDKKSYDSLV